MRVSGLDSSGDWNFGRGKASYLVDGNAVRQNLQTRLKSFTSDWFLDVNANIDWITLLSNKNTEDQIKREVERVTLSTSGIASIESLELDVNSANRAAIIRLRVTDIYGSTFDSEVGINGQS
jgi:hypothetical protein